MSLMLRMSQLCTSSISDANGLPPLYFTTDASFIPFSISAACSLFSDCITASSSLKASALLRLVSVSLSFLWTSWSVMPWRSLTVRFDNSVRCASFSAISCSICSSVRPAVTFSSTALVLPFMTSVRVCISFSNFLTAPIFSFSVTKNFVANPPFSIRPPSATRLLTADRASPSSFKP